MMKPGFKRYDPADYLQTDEEMLYYLEACFEEAGDIVRAKGMPDIAAATGLTREGLYKTLSKDGDPSFSAILKVMKALWLKLKPVTA